LLKLWRNYDVTKSDNNLDSRSETEERGFVVRHSQLFRAESSGKTLIVPVRGKVAIGFHLQL